MGSTPIAAILALLCSACGTSPHESVNAEQMPNVVKHYNALLNFRADGKSYNSVHLAKQEIELQKFGLGQSESRRLVLELLNASVAPDKMNDFEKSSVGMAKLFDLDAVDAGRQIGAAFTESYRTIADFDNRYNFLTARQRAEIRDLFDQGRFAEGRVRAFAIFKAKCDAVPSPQASE